MKKLVILLMMFMGVINISAQEINESQKVDSLQFQLNKLRHDYDYLYCSSELYRLINELNIYSNNLNSNANRLLIDFYHGGYHRELYKVYKDSWDASAENLISRETTIKLTKVSLLLKIENSDFTEMELNVLEAAFDGVDAALFAAKNALNYHKVILDMYKDLD